MPIVFNSASPLLPEVLRNIHSAATSLVRLFIHGKSPIGDFFQGFLIPIVRQLWWWVGVRPVSRSSMRSILQSGKSVVFVPGGIREIAAMKTGVEVVYLKERYGFVKLAIQMGVPLVPVFAFGQTQAYTIPTSLSRCNASPLILNGGF